MYNTDYPFYALKEKNRFECPHFPIKRIDWKGQVCNFFFLLQDLFMLSVYSPMFSISEYTD